MFFVSGCNPESTAPRQVDWGSISGQFVGTPPIDGIAGEELPDPIQVLVQDAGGPVQGVTVEWSVRSGNGSLFVSHSSTDVNGIASNRWTLGTDASLTQTVHAKAVLSSGEKKDFGDFSLTAIAGPPTQIAITGGDLQKAKHGTAVANPLQVQLKDKNDNPVPFIPITFAIATGGGNLNGNPAQETPTGLDGVASVTGWVLESTPCKNTLVATVTGFPGIGTAVIFSATAQDCWSTQASLPGPQTLLGAAVANGFLYAVGGSNAGGVNGATSAFIPSLNVWAQKAPMSTPREGLAVAVVANRLYAVGGCATRQVGTFCPAPLSTVESYDPATNTWTPGLAPMPTPRANLALAAFSGKLYAIGGTTLFGVSSAVEAYDPGTNTWTAVGALASMPTPRGMLAAGVVGGRIYVVGGVDGTNLTQNAVEAYDPTLNTWTPGLAPMPTPRLQLAIGVAGGLLYAVGGSTSNGFGLALQPSHALEAYDPVANTWTAAGALAAMVTARFGLAAGVVDGVVYAVGGTGAAPTGATEAYTP
ncbi:MAG: Kelch repeat-containing protein [Gemmatimonadales bacterium]